MNLRPQHRLSLVPRSWLRLPRRTARLRLTLLYGGLFLACGAGLLAITYELVRTGAVERANFPTSRLHLVAPAHRPGSKLLPKTRPDLSYADLQKKVDLSHQLLWSAVALGIMAVVSIGVGWYVAGRVLRPVRTITRTARVLSARNLGERLALNGPDDEFKELGDTLDELLARLQSAFDAQRHFVANASHELRTPLSWERSLIEVALADPHPTIKSFRDMCDELLVANDQQQRLIDGLLTLASSETALEHREPIDLHQLAGRVLLAQEHEIERYELDIRAAIEPATAIGDSRLIERLITNLIQNAAHHNAPGGHVEIVTTIREQRALLTVANSGPVIPPSEVQRLFEPFQRLNGGRTGQHNGHGLGLSIVRAIATAHNAPLVAQPRHGGGLKIEVSFPAGCLDPKDEPGTAAICLSGERGL